MNNKYESLANEISQYVTDHLHERIAIESLAQHVGVSKFHLNRIFQSITGLPLGEYIQRRKMEFAYGLLAKGQCRVIDVAVAVGYDSHASFTRAFVKTYHFKPSELQSDVKPLTSHVSAKVHREASIQPQEYLQLSAKTLQGLVGQGFQEQSFSQVAETLFEKVFSILEGKLSIPVTDCKVVGVALDHPWRDEGEDVRFFAGVSIESHPTVICSDFETYEWKAGLWAKFVHQGPYRYMWQTFSKIYSGWVIPESIELRDMGVVQVYKNNPQQVEESELITELYFPIAESP